MRSVMLLLWLVGVGGLSLSIGGRALEGLSASEAALSLRPLRQLGVHPIVLLPFEGEDSSLALLGEGSVDGLVIAGRGSCREQLGEAHGTCAGGEWLHVAVSLEECTIARQLGARVVLIHQDAAAEDALERLGFVALGIIEDHTNAICASIADLPEALERARGLGDESDDEPPDVFSERSGGRVWEALSTEPLEAGADKDIGIASGAKATPTPGSLSREHKFCVECGTKLPRTAKFCFECGYCQPQLP
ncbi:MAG: hypothetical protein SGPRY_007165 [Prymnesium sp.]